MFSLGILWPFAEGRGHSDQHDRFPSYEVVVCCLVLNVAQSPMPNSTHTRLRMLACGCLLLPTEFFGEALDWFFIHDTHTFLHNFLCAYKEGFTSSISHHSLLTIPSTVLSWIQLLCDEILQNFYTKKKSTHPPKLFSIVDFLDPCLFSSFH